MPLGGDQIRPTESVSPAESASAPAAPVSQPTVAVEPVPSVLAPETAPAPINPQPSPPVSDPLPAPVTTSAALPNADTTYRPTTVPTPSPTGVPADTLSWEAEEFAHHAKDSRWYGMAIAAAVGIAAVVYLINRDIITSVIVLFAIAGLAFFSGRQPRMQRYDLTTDGIQVGNKWYDFADFQGFSITADSPTTRSIMLVPLKRFMPLVTINLPPEQEDAAAAILESVLPTQQRQGDAIDRFMSRLRF